MIPGHSEVTVIGSIDRNSEDCEAARAILSRIGDKWSVLIIVLLGDGRKRFNEIKRIVGDISQRMLTLTLRGLERDGLVTRKQYPTIPPRVEYELTRLGHSLRAAVQPLNEWAQEHVKDVRSAHAKYEQRKKAEAEKNPDSR